MKTKKFLITILVMSVIIAGIGFVSFASSEIKTMIFYDKNHEKPVEYVKPEFGINENGETYGSIMDIAFEDYPDLAFVCGDNDIYGYCKTIELYGERPQSPEEAIRMQEEREKSGETMRPRVIKVYEKDGVTAIDTFTMGPAVIGEIKSPK